MKKLIIVLVAILASTVISNAQGIRVGIKAGPNFSSFNGDVEGIDFKMRTGFHAGAVVEIKTGGNFSVQGEALFSAQGANSDVTDIDLNYVSIPVLAKFYIITDILSLEAGPQFSYLTETLKDEGFDESFDFGLGIGASVNITKSFFASARYTVGLTEVSRDADITNSVFQISVGYMFL